MENQNSQISRRSRQRYSREEKQKHVQDQATSGVSAAAYCRERGLYYGNFINWSRQRTAAVPELRSMELVAGPARFDAIVEIRFARGQILLVNADCPEKMVLSLAKILS